MINFLIVLVEVKPTSNEATIDTHTLKDLEEKICISAEEAVNAYNNAVYIIKQYTQVIILSNINMIFYIC